MTKCDNCNKGITSRSPGLECRSCSKTVHASKACSGLTAKQLSAIRNADSLGWICDECNHNSPNRKSSFFVPEEVDEEEDPTTSSRNLINCNIESDKFLNDITAELKRVLKKELQPIDLSVKFCSQKIDELTKTVEAQNKHIQELEKKYTHLSNEKSHLELEVSSLKQHLRNIEQQSLNNVLEVIGIPKTEDEDLESVSDKLAEAFNMNKNQIINIKRVENRNDREGNIKVELKQEEHVSAWVRASRQEEVLVSQIIPEAPEPVS